MMTHNAENSFAQPPPACFCEAQDASWGAARANPEDTVELRIPGQSKYVYIARQAVDAISQEIDLSKDDRAAVRLAVGEACNNAVRYSKAKDVNSPSPVTISFRVGQEALEIDVVNSGNGLLPTLGAKMPDPLAENGRGIALIEAMMDSVEFQAANGNTIVRMRKLRTPK